LICHFSDFSKDAPKDGTLAQLLSGYCGETINSTISRLYRKADFDLERASRGIVFLDGMHKIGENQGLSKVEQQQVLREIMQIVEGSVPVDVTRAGSTSSDREVLNTANMFFICFGVFEAEEQVAIFYQFSVSDE
jgi:ATP-dependent Clp protease ATP-binding subunit ClpX